MNDSIPSTYLNTHCTYTIYFTYNMLLINMVNTQLKINNILNKCSTIKNCSRGNIISKFLRQYCI